MTVIIIVFGHEYYISTIYCSNISSVSSNIYTLGFVFIYNFLFSIDIFFVLSGFFIGYKLI